MLDRDGYAWLTVSAVEPETDQAKSIVMLPPPGARAAFSYAPGQFLTFRIPQGAGEIERSYSLSSAPSADPDMTVCVKRVAGGRGSNWMNDHLAPGDRIQAKPPAGRFTLRDGAKPVLLIAGGSGITPCLGLLKQVLHDTDRRVWLIYANQNNRSVIYRAAIDSLAARFPARLQCRHWIDTDAGFLTVPDILSAADACGPAKPDCYICGPDPLMEMAEQTLASHLGDDALILTERFAAADRDHDPNAAGLGATDPTADTANQANTSGAADAAGAPPSPDAIRITLDGADHSVRLTPGQTLLQAALDAGLPAPNACTEGHCGACMGQLREGQVAMASTKALSKRNLARGYVLACQARPTSAEPVWLDFDF